ncbi:hypothetical protein CW304_00080 [Bacillus sp. UFRGS-B20]|nr:hypothetical protein CW304_00080 [Bacillus sp. UFRGS-B20]
MLFLKGLFSVTYLAIMKIGKIEEVHTMNAKEIRMYILDLQDKAHCATWNIGAKSVSEVLFVRIVGWRRIV